LRSPDLSDGGGGKPAPFTFPEQEADMATMLYRAGKEMLVNNDLWCDTLTVEDDAVDAALADGWCLHYSETPARAAEMLAEAEAAEAERLAAETKRKPKAD
jgi:hypothetical protein